MSENKTQKTTADVDAFLDSVENKTRREDGRVLTQMMREVTGHEPTMWGPAIIGFDEYHYVYESGREGDSPLVAFSPRKQNLTLYVLSGYEGQQTLLDKLGKHTTSKVCLYVNKLADVDLDVLREIIHHAYENNKAYYGSSAS